MKSSDLFTRPAANAGRRVDIPGPDGKPTGEWMTIRHVDCDDFRKKRAEILASAAMLPADTPAAFNALDADLSSPNSSSFKVASAATSHRPSRCLRISSR